MKRIAIHRICGIGDAVQLTPLLQQIRHDCPDAHISCFISENAAAVLQESPWIDDLIALSLASVTPTALNPLLWRMWLEVASRGHFDLFLGLGARWRDSLGAFLVRAKRRGGLSTSASYRLQPFQIIESLPRNPREDQTHASKHYLDLWTRITGYPDQGYRSALPNLGHSDAVSRWNLPGKYLCVAPGAGNWLNPAFNKRWPPSHWQQLIEFGIASGYTPVLLGTRGDFPDDKLAAGAASMLGATNLEETACVLRHSQGFIGHDSGLFHMALALDIRSAAFFGPTREDLTGPFRHPNAKILRHMLPCSPCCSATCQLPDAASQAIEGTPICMSRITPTDAWQQIERFLSS